MPEYADQIAALVHYVQNEFPDHDVWDTWDGDRSAHTVSVEISPGGVLLLTASFEFLSDYDPGQVTRLLNTWTAADVLREAGPTKRLLVTRDGCSVTNR